MSGNSLQEELASTKRKIENTEADIAAIMEVIKIAKNNHRKEEWKILNTRLDKLEDRLNLLQRKENILLEQEKGAATALNIFELTSLKVGQILNAPVTDLSAEFLGQEYYSVFGYPPNTQREESLFIRHCYEHLKDIIVAGITKAVVEERRKLFQRILTGTPGIGKSMFLSYLIRFLAEMPEIKYIVIDNDRTRFAFKRNAQSSAARPLWSKLKGDIFWEDFPFTVLLSDPSGSETEIRAELSHHIVICPPNIEHVSRLISKDMWRELLIMPVFSYRELVEMNQTMRIPLDETALRSRYERYGGVPRVIFAGKETPWMDFSLLSSDELIAGLSTVSSSRIFNKNDSIPNTMIHFTVEGITEEDDDVNDDLPDYTCAVRIFGSDYYAQRFLQALDERKSTELAWFLAANRRDLVLGNMVGNIFEDLLVKRLCTSDPISVTGYWLQKIMDLSVNNSVELQLPTSCEVKYFPDADFLPAVSIKSSDKGLSSNKGRRKASELLSSEHAVTKPDLTHFVPAANVIYRPRSKLHTAYDLYIHMFMGETPICLGIQVTKAYSGDGLSLISLQRFQNYCDGNNLKPYMALFVLEDVAERHQKLKPIARNKEEKGVIPPQIPQLVVSIPYSALFNDPIFLTALARAEKWCKSEQFLLPSAPPQEPRSSDSSSTLLQKRNAEEAALDKEARKVRS